MVTALKSFAPRNYAHKREEDVTRYAWRGFFFKVSRAIKVVTLYGGGTDQIFQGAIYEVENSVPVRAVCHTNFPVGNLREAKLSEAAVLLPGQTYLLATGGLTKGYYYLLDRIDTASLLESESLITEWHPSKDSLPVNGWYDGETHDGYAYYWQATEEDVNYDYTGIIGVAPVKPAVDTNDYIVPDIGFGYEEITEEMPIPQYSPSSYIKLQFTSGDSEPYDMGIYYVDKTQNRVGDGTTRIDARNAVGKYLKDQSFDENHYYPEQGASTLLESILSSAGLTNYYVAANNTLLGFDFPPNKNLLDGIEEIIQYLPGWQLREEVTGKIVIGPPDDAQFTQPSTYTFRRDQDIFSREQVMDDRTIYGRVCVQTEDGTIRVYRPVTTNLGWSPPARKTLYQQVPMGTTSYEAAQIATKLAESLSNSGKVETFLCAFRPQIVPGDAAEILNSDGAKMLGIITQVKHSFGTGGFFTEIVVDSGGRIGKPRFKEIIGSLAPPPASKRL